MTDLSSLRGARVLVTGASGFKGSWLSWWLLRLGAKVTGLALPPEGPSLFEATRLSDDIDWVVQDLRDQAGLAQAVRRAKPDVVFHLAAQALVSEGYRDPVGTFATNAMGTAHLLEALRTVEHPVGVVVVSSDKCYADQRWVHGYRETDPLGGNDPYSASKAATEIVTQSWRASFFPPQQLNDHGIAIASARAGNVFGPGDRAANRLVPDTIFALLAGRRVELRHPHAIRPWQHVLEPLAGYLALGARLSPRQPTAVRADAAEAWNFGPYADAARPVAEVVHLLETAWTGARRTAWQGAQSGGQDTAPLGASIGKETATLRLSVDKAVGRLGWRPRWTLAEALALTAGGEKALHGADTARARAVLDSQLDAYTSLLATEHLTWNAPALERT